MGCARRARGRGGFSTMEVIVVLALIGLILGLVMPRFTSRALNMLAESQDFADNLEVARSLARSRTRHYRVAVTSTTQYVLQREATVGGGWGGAVVERTITLRPEVAFDAASNGRTATFDSRGRLVGAEQTFTLLDTRRGRSRQVVVRTTGMVELQ
jgi:Tfp pilus assembly protein FimT